MPVLLHSDIALRTTLLQQPKIGQLIRELQPLSHLTQSQRAASLGVASGTIDYRKDEHMQPSVVALKPLKSLLELIRQSSPTKLQQTREAPLNKDFSAV